MNPRTAIRLKISYSARHRYRVVSRRYPEPLELLGLICFFLTRPAQHTQPPCLKPPQAKKNLSFTHQPSTLLPSWPINRKPAYTIQNMRHLIPLLTLPFLVAAQSFEHDEQFHECTTICVPYTSVKECGDDFTCVFPPAIFFIYTQK